MNTSQVGALHEQLPLARKQAMAMLQSRTLLDVTQQVLPPDLGQGIVRFWDHEQIGPNLLSRRAASLQRIQKPTETFALQPYAEDVCSSAKEDQKVAEPGAQGSRTEEWLARLLAERSEWSAAMCDMRRALQRQELHTEALREQLAEVLSEAGVRGCPSSGGASQAHFGRAAQVEAGGPPCGEASRGEGPWAGRCQGGVPQEHALHLTAASEAAMLGLRSELAALREEQGQRLARAEAMLRDTRADVDSLRNVVQGQTKAHEDTEVVRSAMTEIVNQIEPVMQQLSCAVINLEDKMRGELQSTYLDLQAADERICSDLLGAFDGSCQHLAKGLVDEREQRSKDIGALRHGLDAISSTICDNIGAVETKLVVLLAQLVEQTSKDFHNLRTEVALQQSQVQRLRVQLDNSNGIAAAQLDAPNSQLQDRPSPPEEVFRPRGGSCELALSDAPLTPSSLQLSLRRLVTKMNEVLVRGDPETGSAAGNSLDPRGRKALPRHDEEESEDILEGKEAAWPGIGGLSALIGHQGAASKSLWKEHDEPAQLSDAPVIVACKGLASLASPRAGVRCPSPWASPGYAGPPGSGSGTYQRMASAVAPKPAMCTQVVRVVTQPSHSVVRTGSVLLPMGGTSPGFVRSAGRSVVISQLKQAAV